MDAVFKIINDLIPKDYKPMIVPVLIAFPLLYAFLFITVDRFADCSIFDRVMLAIAGSIVEIVFCFTYFTGVKNNRASAGKFTAIRFESYVLTVVVLSFIAYMLFFAFRMFNGNILKGIGGFFIYLFIFVIVWTVASVGYFPSDPKPETDKKNTKTGKEDSRHNPDGHGEIISGFPQNDTEEKIQKKEKQ